MERRRLALLIEYDGENFHGYQEQGDLRTVQKVLTEALSELTGESDLVLFASSRTDQGVHARGLVCHVDTACQIPCDRLPMALNCRLPDDLALLQAIESPIGFHARHDAIGKIYTYRYYLSSARPVLSRLQSAHVFLPVNIEKMQQAILYLLGTHDFHAMMDSNNNPRHSTIRTIKRLELTQKGPELTLTVEGNGFLYHMVRILAGTLLYVGLDRIRPEDLSEILKSRDRRQAGKTMPPQGLCLEKVFYTTELFAGGQR